MGGYLTLGHYRSAPIRAHWTIILFGAWFARDSVAHWFALFFLILIHQLGHALLVRYFRHRIATVTLTGFGGTVDWSGPANAFHDAAIAWGGVLAQATIWVATMACLRFAGIPDNDIALATSASCPTTEKQIREAEVAVRALRGTSTDPTFSTAAWFGASRSSFWCSSPRRS